MTVATRSITAEELFAMGDIGRCELINGEIIHMAPAGFEHGGIAQEVARRIGNFVVERKLGQVSAAETGFIIARNPDTTRAPDVAFVRRERLIDVFVKGYFEGAPDLAVEVVSPNDLASEVNAKVEQWLAAGAVSVWVVDPKTRTIQVYRKDGKTMRYRENEILKDELTLPGFEMKVGEVFTT